MYFHVYRDQANPSHWRWTFYASNGRKLANSGESYWNKEDCKHAIDLLAANAGGARVTYDN